MTSAESLRVVNRFWERYRSSATLKNTFWLGSASAIGGLFGAVSSAILGRTLGVEAFGVFTLLLTFIGMMTDFGDLGSTATFVRFGSESIAAKDSDRFRDVVAVILRLKVGLATLLVIVSVLFLQRLVPSAFGHLDEALTAYSGLTLVIVLLSIAAGIFYPIFQSFQDFRTHSLLNMGRAFTKMVLLGGVVIVAVQLTVAGALWIEFTAVLLFLVLSFAFSPFHSFTLRVSDRALTRSMMVFNRWILFAQIVAVIAGRLDVFFVGGMMDTGSLGLYGAAVKIAGLVMSVTNAYYAVLLAGVSSAIASDTLQTKVRNAWKAVTFISIGILALVVLAGPLVAIVFGGRFEGAGPILQVMCVGLFFSVLAYPTNAFLFARNHSLVFTLMAGFSLVGVVSVSLLLIPRFGAVGAALGYSASACVACLVSAVYFLAVRRRQVSPPLIP
jgi:O-antigen/teichoic acid export membrane protein